MLSLPPSRRCCRKEVEPNHPALADLRRCMTRFSCADAGARLIPRLVGSVLTGKPQISWRAESFAAGADWIRCQLPGTACGGAWVSWLSHEAGKYKIVLWQDAIVKHIGPLGSHRLAKSVFVVGPLAARFTLEKELLCTSPGSSPR